MLLTYTKGWSMSAISQHGTFSIGSDFKGATVPNNRHGQRLFDPLHPFSPYMFVLIDQQRMYCDPEYPGGGTQDTAAVAKHNANVLKRFHDMGVRVMKIYTGSGLMPEALSEAMGGSYALSGLKADEFFQKITDSPYDCRGDDFKNKMQNLGARKILVAGFHTSRCVESFVMDALQKQGLEVALLTDCTTNGFIRGGEHPLMGADNLLSEKQDSFERMCKAGAELIVSQGIFTRLHKLVQPAQVYSMVCA